MSTGMMMCSPFQIDSKPSSSAVLATNAIGGPYHCKYADTPMFIDVPDVQGRLDDRAAKAMSVALLGVTVPTGTCVRATRSDAMSEQAAVLNHTGLCVSDGERSVRFYTEVFGFQYWRDFEPPDELAAPLLGLEPPLDHYNVYLRLGSFVLELLVFRGATPPHPPAARRVMNELGLTHLSISVPDIPATCARVVEHGGTVD